MLMSSIPLRYVLISALIHIAVILFLMLSFEWSAEHFVFKQTHKNDIMSAVILGDTPQSKIMSTATPVVSKTEQEKPKPKEPAAPSSVHKEQSEPKKVVQTEPKIVKKDVIALEKKSPARVEKKQVTPKPTFLEKELLEDIQKVELFRKKHQEQKLSNEFKKTLRLQTEQSLRQQFADANIKVSAAAIKESQGKVDQYKALILQAISEHWLVPPGAKKNLYAELMIRLAPGGVVLQVEITKLSGDLALDRSVRAAVFKASPLPVPRDTKAFEAFRAFTLKVKPE